jgi:hypothetical protein
MTSHLVRLLLVGVLLAACQATAIEPPSQATTAAPTAAPIAAPTPTVRPTPTAQPSPRPTPTLPPPAAFAMNLYQDGDFVPQHTFEWCVGASLQIAHNLVESDIRSSYEDQQGLWELARDASSNSFRGANPVGWTAALNEMGLGPYELVSVPDYEDALHTAAAAIHDTERPVGLVMWRGRHAWVMSGFESMGDPAIHADFRVTGVRVLDPLFPHGSGRWGPSPEPNSLLSPEELATQFVVREPRRWSAALGTGYFLILPVAAAEADDA